MSRSELSVYLSKQKRIYIRSQETGGATAPGFRAYVEAQRAENPDFFAKLYMDALAISATKTWQNQPRKEGPDLFSVAGYTYAEHLTRMAAGYVPDPDKPIDENDENFEKVDKDFATIQDAYDDAMIKMRAGAQTVARAERQMKATDMALRRARGNRGAKLADHKDAPDNKVPDAAE